MILIGESKPGKTVKGEVVRAEDNDFFVREENGKVMRMHVDSTTINLKKPLKVKPGDFVEAKVDDQVTSFHFYQTHLWLIDSLLRFGTRRGYCVVDYI